MRALINRHRLATALAVVGLYASLYIVMAMLRAPVGTERALGINFDMIERLFWPEFGLAASALVLTALFGWWRETRLITPPAPRSARILIVPALMILFLLGLGELITQTSGVRPSSGQVWIAAKTIICVGIFEELVFRGIVFHGFESRYGPIKAVFASSVLFGLMHYTNALNGQDLLISHFQVLHAFGIGVFFAAITVRTNSLWPAIIFHAVWDTVLALNQLRAGEMMPTEVPVARDMAPALLLVGAELAIGLSILLFWARGQRKTF